MSVTRDRRKPKSSISTRRRINSDITVAKHGGRWTNNSTQHIENTLQRALLEFNSNHEDPGRTGSWSNMMHDDQSKTSNVRQNSRTTFSTNLEETNTNRGRQERLCSLSDTDYSDINITAQHNPYQRNQRHSMLPRQTKIICAIGPACREISILVQMLDAGMNVARLNFSHETLEYHIESLHNLRKALQQRPDLRCAVLMDTKGPEIRTGKLMTDLNHTSTSTTTCSNGLNSVQLIANQYLLISTNIALKGNANRISCTYTGLATTSLINTDILCSDGLLSFHIVYCSPKGGTVPKKYNSVMKNMKNQSEEEKNDVVNEKESEWTKLPYIIVLVKNNGILGESKNMNIPNVDPDLLPSLTKKDIYDINHFVYQYNIDIVSCSLVRTAKDITNVRKCLLHAKELYIKEEEEKRKKEKEEDLQEHEQEQEHRKQHKQHQQHQQHQHTIKNIRVHAKIESIQALTNIDAIVQESDGVHVSRGDLGMALPLQKVFLAQKMIILRARRYGKPVITSTEMLDSMIINVRPSHAECTDVANAVLDGTDGMMLSGECARGIHPIGSVRMMSSIARAAESCIDYHSEFLAMRDFLSIEDEKDMKVWNEIRTENAMQAMQRLAMNESLNEEKGKTTKKKTESKMTISKPISKPISTPLSIPLSVPFFVPVNNQNEMVAASAVDTAFKLGAKLIIVFSLTGHLAMQVSKYRPGIPVVALTQLKGGRSGGGSGSGSQGDECDRYSQGVANQVGSLSRGVYGWTYNKNDSSASFGRFPILVLQNTMEKAAGMGWIQRGDAVVSLWSNNNNADKNQKEKKNSDENVVRFVTSVNYYMNIQ